MPFKDTQEGQTHFYGDGCGESEHNPVTPSVNATYGCCWDSKKYGKECPNHPSEKRCEKCHCKYETHDEHKTHPECFTSRAEGWEEKVETILRSVITRETHKGTHARVVIQTAALLNLLISQLLHETNEESYETGYQEGGRSMKENYEMEDGIIEQVRNETRQRTLEECVKAVEKISLSDLDEAKKTQKDWATGYCQATADALNRLRLLREESEDKKDV